MPSLNASLGSVRQLGDIQNCFFWMKHAKCQADQTDHSHWCVLIERRHATSIVCSVLVLCFVIFVAPSPEIHWKPFQIFPELRWNFSYIDPSPVRAILTLNSVQEHWDGSIIGACSPGLGQFVVLSCFITANGSKVWVGMKFGNFNLSNSQRKGESWLQHAPAFQRGRLLETRGFKWLFRFLSCIEYDDAASIA